MLKSIRYKIRRGRTLEKYLSSKKNISPRENLDTFSKILSDILRMSIVWIISFLLLGWIAWQFDSVEPYDPDITKFWLIFGLGLVPGARIMISRIERFGKSNCWVIRLFGAAMIPASFIFAMMVV